MPTGNTSVTVMRPLLAALPRLRTARLYRALKPTVKDGVAAVFTMLRLAAAGAGSTS